MSYDENRISDLIDGGLRQMDEDYLREENKWMDSVMLLHCLAEKQMHKDNLRRIKKCGKNAAKDFDLLIGFCDLNGRVETVKQPSGDRQNESAGIFKDIHVDQWSVGMEGDSYEGYIYAKYNKRRWLKIPYSC